MRANFDRTLLSLDALFAFLDEFFRKEQIDAATGYLLSVATEELFTNLVKYNARVTASIAIELVREADEITLQITDREVAPFDITVCELPSIDPSLVKRGKTQMGLHLVRGIADSLDYNHQEGSTTIILKKYLRNPYVHSSS
jgi:anti-sigma regulatory factor (Ser/Thr protein kinase)